MLLTTGQSFEGFPIIKYLDVIYDEVCFSEKLTSQIINRLNDTLSSVASIFEDTELSGTTEAVLKAKDYVKEKLIKKAEKLGANAIIGIDFETSFGTAKSWIRVAISGTAVSIKSLDDIEKDLSKKQAEVQTELERQQIIEKQREVFKEMNTFKYSDHNSIIESMKTAKEIVQYLESLNIKDEYFNSSILAELRDDVEIERLYGNQKDTVINKLKKI